MTTPREPSPELIERAKRMADGEEFYVDVPTTGTLGSDTEETIKEPAKPTTKRQRPRSINHGEFVRKEDK